jgi:hypothetical protein
VQIPAIQRPKFGVDKNLYGVSGQVTAPGVLAFGHIFTELRGGKENRWTTPSKLFARKQTRDRRHRGTPASTLRNEARRRPMRAAAGNEQMSAA